MKPDLVVDVGNSRIKWGLCQNGQVSAGASLPPDDETAWEDQLRQWNLTRPRVWTISGVHPPRRDRLARWARERGDNVFVLDDWQRLGLVVRLDQPQRAGIDRLLNAVALRVRRPSRVPAVIIDAGSAITVDWVDHEGAFCGGSIFPGLGLMAKALHDYTALLPEVSIPPEPPLVLGTTIPEAMRSGIYYAAAGGIVHLVELLRRQDPACRACPVFLTGGDARLLATALPSDFDTWPLMTLEGLRLVAESLA